MLFVDGNPNLVDYTRFLVNDPSTAVTTQFSTQEVKDSVNLAYFSVLADIKEFNDDIFKKVSFADTVQDQVFYALPSDFNRPFLLEVDYDGNNLDTGSTKNPTKMKPVDYELLEDQRALAPTQTYLWSQLHQHIAIYPVVGSSDTTGTKSLRLVYEFEPTALSADSDEPIIIPTEFHRLISVRAAKDLKIARDLSYGMLERENLAMSSRLIEKMARKFYRGADQFGTTSFDHSYDHATNAGNFKSVT